MSTLIVPVSGQVVYRDNYEKGYAFEEFITKLFNERSFQVKLWLKAGKRPDHLPWADLTNPDLQMELVFAGARKYRFAVECKWRRECSDGMIKWAEVPQIYNYERFQRETGIPVFVAIGVGGEPNDPERLYVMPLDLISRDNVVLEREMMEFRMRPGRRFFYDVRQGKLW